MGLFGIEPIFAEQMCSPPPPSLPHDHDVAFAHGNVVTHCPTSWRYVVAHLALCAPSPAALPPPLFLVRTPSAAATYAVPAQTSCKDAIKGWEAKEGKPVAEESCVKLCFRMPPIAKMDPALKELAHVEQLSLSTNQIEKIANLNGFSAPPPPCFPRSLALPALSRSPPAPAVPPSRVVVRWLYEGVALRLHRG